MSGDLFENILRLKHQSEKNLIKAVYDTSFYEAFCQQDDEFMKLIRSLI